MNRTHESILRRLLPIALGSGLARFALWVLAGVLWLWSLLALYLFPAWPVWLQVFAAMSWLMMAAVWLRKAPGRWKPLGLIAGFLLVRGVWEFNRPSADRDWASVNAQTVSAEFDRESVRIRNFRSAVWRGENDFDLHWENRALDLTRIRTVDFIVVPFGLGRTMAHTFLTFGFEDGEYVAISVEIRKERGETYSPLKGMFRHYEIIYVVGDETDLIALRTAIYQEPVYLFPIKTPPEKVRELFVSMLRRANRLAERPEFYNTLLNNCHLHIVWQANLLRQEKAGFDWRNVFAGHADELAWELGLINFDGTLEQARRQFLINGRSARASDRKLWSRQIRLAPPATQLSETERRDSIRRQAR